jgi:hypothetical protein
MLRAARRGGPAGATLVRDLDALWDPFNRTGEQVMMLQERIEASLEVRCLCVGHDQVFLVQVDPESGWAVGPKGDGWLAGELRERMRAQALTLSRALGHDLAEVRFLVRDGVPFVVEPADPVPLLDPEHLTDAVFHEVVERFAAVAVARARGEPRRGSRYVWADALAVARG